MLYQLSYEANLKSKAFSDIIKQLAVYICQPPAHAAAAASSMALRLKTMHNERPEATILGQKYFFFLVIRVAIDRENTSLPVGTKK